MRTVCPTGIPFAVYSVKVLLLLCLASDQSICSMSFNGDRSEAFQTKE